MVDFKYKAAVKLIVEEANGKVTNLYGKEQSYDEPISGAIVSNNINHEKYLKDIQKYLK